MKHQPIKYIILASILLLSCNTEQNREQAQNTGTDSLLSDNEDYINGLKEDKSLMLNLKQISNFPEPDSFSLKNITEGDGTADFYKYDADLTDSFFIKYGPMIVFNDDSTKFIDGFSYRYMIDFDTKGKRLAAGGDPESEVAIVDVRTKKRTRILYCGTTCSIEKVFWYNKDIIGILALNSENADDKYIPVLWFMNIINGETANYTYDHKTGMKPGDYLSRELAAKGIIFKN